MLLLALGLALSCGLSGCAVRADLDVRAERDSAVHEERGSATDDVQRLLDRASEAPKATTIQDWVIEVQRRSAARP